MRRLIALALATLFLSLALFHPLAHAGGHPDDSCVACQAQRDPLPVADSPSIAPAAAGSLPVRVLVPRPVAQSVVLAEPSRGPPSLLAA